MRPVQLADIEVAARSLWPLHDHAARQARVRSILTEARIADKYRKRMGKPHPHFGNGTLMSAATGFAIAPRPSRCDRDYLACLAIVIAELTAASGNQET